MANCSPLVLLWPDRTIDARWLDHTLLSVEERLAIVVPQGWGQTRIPGLEIEPEAGLAVGLNAALARSPGSDVVVIVGQPRLPHGWLNALAAAAGADDTAAGAIPLLGGNVPAFDDFALPEGDVPVSSPVHPRVLRLSPQCSYLCRPQLDLLGGADEAFATPAAVLDDYCSRALNRGFVFVLADDCVVGNEPSSTGPPTADEVARLQRGHPWRTGARAAEDALEIGALRRALVASRARQKQRLSVTIDGRSIASGTSGSETYTVGLIRALAASGHCEVRVLVRDEALDLATELLHGEEVSLLGELEASGEVSRTDIAHRPQQAFVPEDLFLLRKLGERVVISHLDLIGYRNPTYHVSLQEWQRYRRLTRFALGAADRVIFLSQHAQHEAITEELIEGSYSTVIGASVATPRADAPRRAPVRVPEGKFVVMIGNDYQHKNRLFALSLVDQLRLRHSWPGQLVLAGDHVSAGGSASAEADLLRARPELAERVVDLGPVIEAEKNWLLDHADALLCPSIQEGFGLTPLEAARAGLPCLFAATTSLAEILDPDAATLVPWDATLSADRILPLLEDDQARETHLAMIEPALQRYTWNSIAEQVVELYRSAIDAPYRSSVPRAWEELEREQLIVDIDRARDELNEMLVDLQARVRYGLPLIDRGGLLTRPQQRGLIRVAKRPWLRAPVLGPIGLLGRTRADDGRS